MQKHISQSVSEWREAKNCFLPSEELDGVWSTKEDRHSKGEELKIGVPRKKNNQTIFWIMREQSKFQSKRLSLTGIQGIKFVTQF